MAASNQSIDWQQEQLNKTTAMQRILRLQQLRQKMLLLLLMGILMLALIYFGIWCFNLRNHVTTDNAYTAAEIAQVTSAIDGIVEEIKVTDTQKVTAGDVLLVIDNIDAKISVANATANVAKAKTDLQKTKLNYSRRTSLLASGAVAKEEFTNAEYAYLAAQASFAAAELALEKANIDLKRTVLCAAVDGVIAQRTVQIGQKINAGSQLMVIVPLKKVHVDANFKEGQLRKVKPGQAVTLSSDLYGPKIVFHGKVVGFAGGTGSVFALIPAQNATGNWIKVVQRLAVRIALDQNELEQYPLMVGLSMNVDIDINKAYE